MYVPGEAASLQLSCEHQTGPTPLIFSQHNPGAYNFGKEVVRAVTGITLVAAAATGLEGETDDEDDEHGPITSGRVVHAKHGLGVVTGFTFDGRLQVKFDSGETHRYATERVISKLKRAPNDSPPPPLQASRVSRGTSLEEVDEGAASIRRQGSRRGSAGDTEIGTKARSFELGSLRNRSFPQAAGRERVASASASMASMTPTRLDRTASASTPGRLSSRQQKYMMQAMKTANENSTRRKLKRNSTGSSLEGIEVLEPRLLLYLNEKTFVGEAGEKLADLVRASRSKGVEVLLVHENDRAEGRDGCEFGHLFTTTPQDLIDDGLYKTIAISMYALPHRDVSLALVAQACGALPRNTKHMTTAQRKAVKQKALDESHQLTRQLTEMSMGSKAAKVDLKEMQRVELERFRQEERLEEELNQKKAKSAEAAKAALDEAKAALAEAKMHAHTASKGKGKGKEPVSGGCSDAGAGTSAAGESSAPVLPPSGRAPPQRQKTNRFDDLATAQLKQGVGSPSSQTRAGSASALERAASSTSMPEMLLAGMLYRQLGWRQALRWRRTRICLFSDRVEYLDVVDEGSGVPPTVIRRADINNVHVGDNQKELAFSFTGPDGLGVRLRALTAVDFNNWVEALQTPADQLPQAMAGITSVSAAAMALMAAQACAPSSADAARDWLRREEERDEDGVSAVEAAAAREAAAAEAEAAAEAAAAKAETEAAAEAEAALVASARPVSLTYTPLGFGFELGADGQTITSIKRDSQAARVGLAVGERVLFFSSESGYGNAFGGDDGDELAAAMSGVRIGEKVEFHVAETEASREAKAATAIQAVARGRKIRGVSPPKSPLVAARRASAKIS